MPTFISTTQNPTTSAHRAYVQHKLGAIPPVPRKKVVTTLKKLGEEAARISFDVCHKEADRGNIASMVDVGLCFLAGLGTTVDNHKATVYLERATLTQTTTNEDDHIKATAHALLLESIGVLPHASVQCPEPEVIQVGEFHASQARRLRPHQPLPANVLRFCKTFWRVYVELDIFKDKDLWEAVRLRDEGIKNADEKLKAKRKARPNRYRCAAPGCGIIAEKGKALLQCSGRCDHDYKPNYCSRECQHKDWKNHKQFCKPGAGGPPTREELYDSEGANGNYHIQVIAKEEPNGLDVTLPIKSSNTESIVHVTGKREVLKEIEILEISSLSIR